MRIKRLLALAITVYLLIAPFTYHTDTKLNLVYPSLGGGVWDIYGYLEKSKLDIPPLHYPPLHYTALKLELPITQVLGGKGYTEWLLSDSTQAVSNPQIFQYNLASKLPLLVLAILSGWLIYKLVLRETGKEGGALLATTFWLFNPVTIYAVVAMGQNDIIAIAIFLLGMWFYPKKPWLAFFVFGISGSIKSYPLIWAAVMAMLFPAKSILKKIGLGLVSVAVYLVTLAPFLGSQFFREQVLGSGLVTRFFISGIDLGFGRAVLIVPLLVTVLLVMALLADGIGGLFCLAFFLLAVNFVVLGFSHFHPQWMLWLMPFWAILYPAIDGDSNLRKVNRFLFWAMMAAFTVVVLLFEDAFLSWGILSPLNPNLLNLPIIRDFLSARAVDVSLFDNLAHSLLAGTAIALLFLAAQETHLRRLVSRANEEAPRWLNKSLSMKVGLVKKVLVAVVVPVAFMVAVLVLAKSLPVVAKVSSGSGNVTFLGDKEVLPYSQKFLVTSDSMYRIEILLKNPNLESHDEFLLSVVDDQGKVLVNTRISGFNVGDPTNFRLDFPPTSGSAGKNFTVSITKSKVVDGKLAIGFYDNGGQKTLALDQFSKRLGIKDVIPSSLKEVALVISSEPLVVLLPALMILMI